jgi:hypothetical protein
MKDAQHRTATVTLLFTMLAPGISLVILAGLVLHGLFPTPNPITIILGAVLMVVLLACGLVIGAIVWLFFARYFVERSVIEPFYIYPGVPLFSALSARIFRLAYPPPPPKDGPEQR